MVNSADERGNQEKVSNISELYDHIEHVLSKPLCLQDVLHLRPMGLRVVDMLPVPAAMGVAGGCAMVTASALGAPLGVPTLAAVSAAAVTGCVASRRG